MPYCSQCGVEVDKYVKQCPLCHAPIQALEDNHDEKRKFPIKTIRSLDNPLTKKQKRNIAWGITSVLLLVPIFIILTVRFLYSDEFTWEGYTLIPLTAGWIYFSLLLFFSKKIKTIIAGFFLNTNILLFLFDLLDGKVNWYLTAALPVLALFFFILSGIILLCLKTRRKGLNIVAFILVGCALLCLGIELTVSLNLSGMIVMKWSLIVLVALVPLILFFLYVHYILKTEIDWEKKFYT